MTRPLNDLRPARVSAKVAMSMVGALLLSGRAGGLSGCLDSCQYGFEASVTTQPTFWSLNETALAPYPELKARLDEAVTKGMSSTLDCPEIQKLKEQWSPLTNGRPTDSPVAYRGFHINVEFIAQ